MPRPSPALRAARRARWLAEVATALDHAGSVTLRLAVHAQECEEALALSAQIAALRDQVASIRLGQPQFTGEIDPDRTK